MTRIGKTVGPMMAAMALAGCVIAPVGDAPNRVNGYAPPPAPRYVQPAMRYVPADYSGGFAPAQAFEWIEEADGFAQAIGDAPPDYRFIFDGRDAWAWVSQAGEALIIEQGIDGVVQYYYAPNAAAPYLVRDVYDSFGYAGFDLNVVYDSRGEVHIRPPSQRTLERAEELQARGRAIRSASFDRRWDRDSATRWSSQSFVGFSFGSSFDRGWSGGWRPVWRERDDWHDFAERRRDREARRALDDERRARHDHGRRFRDWQRRGARDVPPAMVAPTPAPVATNPVTDGGQPAVMPTRPGRPRPPAVTPVPAPVATPSPVATVPPSAQPPAGPPRPGRPRRSDMMPGAVTGGPEPMTLPGVSTNPSVDDDAAMQRSLQEQERRDAAVRAAQERDAATRRGLIEQQRTEREAARAAAAAAAAAAAQAQVRAAADAARAAAQNAPPPPAPEAGPAHARGQNRDEDAARPN